MLSINLNSDVYIYEVLHKRGILIYYKILVT